MCFKGKNVLSTFSIFQLKPLGLKVLNINRSVQTICNSFGKNWYNKGTMQEHINCTTTPLTWASFWNNSDLMDKIKFHLNFRQQWSLPKIMKWICSLANSLSQGFLLPFKMDIYHFISRVFFTDIYFIFIYLLLFSPPILLSHHHPSCCHTTSICFLLCEHVHLKDTQL